jgi:hypothetical protein
MRIPITAPLFAWEHLDDQPDLKALRQVLDSVSDEKLLHALSAARDRGRDDYPVVVLWRTLLASIVLRHPTMEACLAELARNEGLCRVVGIDAAGKIPKAWNMSRFLAKLGQPEFLTLIRHIFDRQVEELGAVVPDLGANTAADSTHLSTRTERTTPAKRSAEASLPAPAGAKKEYRDDEGKVTHVVQWLGYKLHLLVDTRHEVPLAFEITSANAADNQHVTTLVDQAQAALPKGRIKTLAYDKAADDHKVHEQLAARDVKPVIQIRKNPNGPTEEVILDRQDRPTQFVHDEAGTVFCIDTVSKIPVRRKMDFWGLEKGAGCLKYRCPAVTHGLSCPSFAKCNTGKAYGATVRIRMEKDLRRFPPIPRATKLFERLYRGRTAVERVNARFKIFWGIDDGNMRGRARFHAQVSAVMLVAVGFARLLAAAPRHEGTLGRTKLSPIAKALRAQQAATA